MHLSVALPILNGMTSSNSSNNQEKHRTAEMFITRSTRFILPPKQSTNLDKINNKKVKISFVEYGHMRCILLAPEQQICVCLSHYGDNTGVNANW